MRSAPMTGARGLLPGRRPFHDPHPVLPEAPDTPALPRRAELELLPPGFAQLDARGGRRDAALARDRLALGLCARPLPVPRPVSGAVPDALDDDLPADRDPRRA